jgi:putative SOS response-associated peptidase YedK
MCGRVRDPNFEELNELRIDPFDDRWTPHMPPRRWNVPPTSDLPVMTLEKGVHILQPMRWGLIPTWSKDDKGSFATFNARADGVDTKPAFRGAWKSSRRCLIATGGFYEWRKAGTSDKQPFAIGMGNGGLVVMAGLWEEWRGTRTCTIITTEANSLISGIHDRMPVILSYEHWERWLGGDGISPEAAKAMLVPFPGERMAMWPVDRKVGSVKNEGPELVERLVVGEERAQASLL